MTKKRASIAENNPLEQNMRPVKQGRRPKNLVRDKKKQTTLLLYKDQLDWLYEVCKIEAREDGGKETNKTYLFRSFVDLAKEKGLNLRGVRSEDDVYERVRELFK